MKIKRKSKRQCPQCGAGLNGIHRAWCSQPPSMDLPVFRNCNVCGRELIRKDELAIGMCAICANE